MQVDVQSCRIRVNMSGFPALQCTGDINNVLALGASQQLTTLVGLQNKLQTLYLYSGTIMKTFVAKPHEVQREWYVIDAKGKVLGRVASEVARRLRGKHKPEFTPHVDTGDYIVIINAAEIVVTGKKAQDKRYYRHSGYPGGITETNFETMQQRFPGRAIQKAVKGMLPKGPLGYAMAKKLKVYAGAEHPHSAQQPKTLDI